MRAVCSLSILIAALGLATSAHAELIVPDPPPEAKKTNEDFERARASVKDSEKAYEDGDLKTSLMHAEAGFQIYPNASTASVVAVVHAARDSHAAAIKWYLLALNLTPPPSTVPDIKTSLTKQIAKLGKPIGWIVVESEVKGARVTVDGTALPKGVLIFGASAGEHVVKATAQGYEPFEAKVTVEDRGEAIVDVRMTKAPELGDSGASGGDPGGVSDKRDSGKDITAPVALMATGGVLLGAAIGLTVWGVGEMDAANEVATGAAGSLSSTEAQRRYEDATSNAEIGLYTAYAGYAIGGALVITGAVLLALDDGEESSTTAAPALLPGGGGLVLGGRF